MTYFQSLPPRPELKFAIHSAHHGEAFYIDILLDQVYTTTICRMKGDRPRLTAPRENAPRLKARLGMEGQGTTAGG